MKHIKRISFALMLLVASIAFSSEAGAWWPSSGTPDSPSHNYSDNGRTRNGHNGHNGHGQAGAPLDGGLLALLAGAGAIYVAKRKKKKNAE